MNRLLKKRFAIILSISLLVSGIVTVEKKSDSVQAAANYQLVWSDEFNGTSLDRSNWNVEVNGDGGGNNELQYYLDNTNNIRVGDGTLKITALKQQYANKQYTSGRITTQRKREFKYGRMEAKMKLPSFMGAWPAFWMLGSNLSNGVQWPACGEIDIMEAINNENKVYGTVHWSYKGNHAQHGEGIDGINRTEWHIYAVEWTKDEIKWFVDDKNFFTQKIDDAAEMEEFRKKHFIIFNLAIGGQWPGYTIDNSAFPSKSTMEVDYVRVYQDMSEENTEYTGPTITVTEDAVEKSTSIWGGYYGSDWSGARGTFFSQNSAKDGIVMNISSVGSDRWGTQAFLNNLSYYPGNIYKYKCTITSNISRKIFVKVAGDDAEQISGEYIQLQPGVAYNYEKDVFIDKDYDGTLDLYFGLGKCDGEAIGANASCNILINNVSFTTHAVIPDPSYQNPTEESTEVTTQPKTTQEPETTPQPEVTTHGEGTTQLETTAEHKTTLQETTLQRATLQETTKKKAPSQVQTISRKVKAPGRAKIKKVKRSKNNRKVKITLKKITKAKGYQIKYSTSRKFKKNRTKTVYTKKRIKTIKKLKANKKYYVKARAYVISNGKKRFGKWSKKKVIRKR